uniref:Pentatricopeptide repeat-containing protein n=1 Tax=Chenopodium quinoa TaxID=63459 RepID=A0A803LSY5_CHEQI
MYNVVIGLFCERGDLDRAMGLMREMESCDLCPDMITYMSMLKGFCFAGRLEDACQLFKTMKSHGCAPNLVAYSALLDGLCRAGSFERALELLGEMEKEGGECTPNVITYTSIIQTLCENGKSVEALSILERMESFKCQPNRITMSVLIQGLCREGYIDKAFKLVNDVVVGGQVSKDECYSSLVISLLWIQRFEDAEKLFRWMLGSAVRPDGFACTVLMKDLCLKGRFFDAFYLYEDVVKKGFVLTIDSDIYSTLLVGLCQENRVEEVGKLANYMVEKGVSINASYIDNIHNHLKGSIEMESLAHLCNKCCFKIYKTTYFQRRTMLQVFSKVSGLFPPMGFNFAGGASVVLRPKDYLVHMGFVKLCYPVRQLKLPFAAVQFVSQFEGIYDVQSMQKSAVKLQTFFNQCMIVTNSRSAAYKIKAFMRIVTKCGRAGLGIALRVVALVFRHPNDALGEADGVGITVGFAPLMLCILLFS